MSVAAQILDVVTALMRLYLQSGGRLHTLVEVAANCDAEIKRIKAQEAADEKAARDLVPHE